jgi:hypothetical protein
MNVSHVLQSQFLHCVIRMSAWAGVERLMVGSSDDCTSEKVYARYPFASQTQERGSQ